MSKLTSGRVKKLPQSGLTSDRYEFLGLNQAEPDLGDPIVGVSSIAAKQYPPGTQYVMINVGGETGSRYWIDSNNLRVGDLSPGSFTVFNNDIQVGLANSFTTFNFVGTGVTVDFVGTAIEQQTGIATVRISVVDVLAPGDEYQIPYNDPISGFLQGASGLVFRSDRNNSVGIGTSITNLDYKLDVIGNVGISSTLFVDEIDVNFIDTNDLNTETVTFTTGIGTDLSVIDLSVGVGGTVLKTNNSYVGIGSTQPQHKLDVDGDVKLGGLIYDFTGSTGSVNEVLLSAGPDTPPAWGGVTNLTIGNAERLNINQIDTNQSFPIGFVTGYSYGQSDLSVDSEVLVYNPGTNRLGIGSTNPQYDLDVSGIVRADQIIVNNISEVPDEVNTTSTAEVILDSFPTSTFRSTRYTIQTTVTGQIREGSASIASSTTGQNYILGTYNDVPVVTSSGFGTGARANITVQTETSPITASFGGIFTTTNNITGVVTGTSFQFDQTLVPTDLEQSKLTSINVTNPGAGFTDIPNIFINSPIIINNPVENVSTGITALVTEVEMEVTNVILNETGITTNTIPNVSYTSPTSGSAAQGYIGFGISTFTVTQSGSAYTESPIINYDQTPIVTPVTQVGLGISDANILIEGGSGYNTGVTTITVDPPASGGITATMILGSVDGNGSITDIDITNVGSGYTQIPGITITNSGSGVGAAITITEMVVTDINVTSVGSGFTTSKPAITFIGGGGAGAAATVTDIEITSIEVSSSGAGYTSADMPVTATIGILGVGNTVALGVTSVNATTGLGYTVAPAFVIDAPTVHPFTGATFTSGIGFGTEFNILAGPEFGGSGVYYIEEVDSNSFRVATDPGFTDVIQLGYNVSLNPNAYIGGSISTITITEKGSGYENGDILTVDNNDLSSPIGNGFSFTVDNLIESYQVSDLLLLQSSGSEIEDASVVEYAGIGNIENLGNYDADISGPNARLKFTPNYAFNTIKISRKGIAP